MTIIERIVITLDEKGKKMADLGRHIGVESSTTSNWKRRNTDPPANMIAPICEFLGVSCEYLLTGEEHSDNHSKDEDSLLELYRRLNDQQKRDTIGAIRLQLTMAGAADLADKLHGDISL